MIDHSWLLIVAGGGMVVPTVTPDCGPALDFTVRRLASAENMRLCEAYRGQVLLIVNTASKCGFTGQYAGLEALYEKYCDRGFSVLGFPSNDFFQQEPGSEDDIRNFCVLNYSIRFPMFEKIHVKGDQAHPLFRHLAEQTGVRPRWNFYKYLIDRSGHAVAGFSSLIGPGSSKLIKAIEAVL